MRVDISKAHTPTEKLDEYRERLYPYMRELRKHIDKGYPDQFASFNLIADSSIRTDIERVYERMVTGRLKYVLVIGIGGSILGTQALYSALEKSEKMRVIFIDTIDPIELRRIYTELRDNTQNADEILINIVSKSGMTTETLAAGNMIITSLSHEIEGIEKRIVVTTGEGSPLWKWAQERSLPTLDIPKPIGGRFSVFSSVGLFPLRCAGIDIDEILRGAHSGREISLSEDNNPALESASTNFYHYSVEGKNICNTFVFHERLRGVVEWYRQLIGESLGKQIDLDGQTVRAGITPTVSVGPQDLHSVGQLYVGGPRDKLFTFLSVNTMPDVDMPKSGIVSGILSQIEGKSAGDILKAINEGAQKTYEHNAIPYVTIELNDMSAYEFGELLQMLMIQIMYCAKLMNVNTFDQPNVEEYKEETRRILESKE